MLLAASLFGQTQINPNQIKRPSPGTRQLIWSEMLTQQLPDGSYLLPLPVAPPGTTQTIVTLGPTVFRNTQRQTPGSDYTLSPDLSRLIPVTPWLSTDGVLVDYWFVINNGPTLAAPSLPTFPIPLDASRYGPVTIHQAKPSWLRRLVQALRRTPVFLGKPCARGHVVAGTIRYLSNGHCVECAKLQTGMTRDQRREYMRTWRSVSARIQTKKGES